MRSAERTKNTAAVVLLCGDFLFLVDLLVCSGGSLAVIALPSPLSTKADWKRYGLRQTIADTLGIGGIMRGLRTIPLLVDICHDMEEVGGDATLHN